MVWLGHNGSTHPRQDKRAHIIQTIFWNPFSENCCILIKISSNLLPQNPISNKTTSVVIVAWHCQNRWHAVIWTSNGLVLLTHVITCLPSFKLWTNNLAFSRLINSIVANDNIITETYPLLVMHIFICVLLPTKTLVVCVCEVMLDWPSICPRVCPSVHHPQCSLCSPYISGSIISIYGKNNHLCESICPLWWLLALMYILKAIRPRFRNKTYIFMAHLSHIPSTVYAILTGFFPYMVQIVAGIRGSVTCDYFLHWPISSRPFIQHYARKLNGFFPYMAHIDGLVQYKTAVSPVH